MGSRLALNQTILRLQKYRGDQSVPLLDFFRHYTTFIFKPKHSPQKQHRFGSIDGHF